MYRSLSGRVHTSDCRSREGVHALKLLKMEAAAVQAFLPDIEHGGAVCLQTWARSLRGICGRRSTPSLASRRAQTFSAGRRGAVSGYCSFCRVLSSRDWATGRFVRRDRDESSAR